MNIKIKDILYDKRMGCISIVCRTDVKSYLPFIEEIFKKKGGIEGQRAPLKTKTAIEIRKRMVDDLVRGAVIPAMVLGVLVDSEMYHDIENNPETIIAYLNNNIGTNSISLIDGMQRTTALKDAFDKTNELDSELRLELWVAKSINNLIYRMLVLNTGQIPWSIKRQLEVVFSSLKETIQSDIEGIELFDEDHKSRRSKAGQYQSSHIIELFLDFSLKKVKVDLKESLTEEFARLDMIESTSNKEFSHIFIKALSYLVKIDKEFEKALSSENNIELKRFKRGYDIFSSHPARVGFVTALAQKIFGKPGISYDESRRDDNIDLYFRALDEFIVNISSMSPSDLYCFLDLPTLDERINIKSGKVGEFERAFFVRVFYEFLELITSDEKINNMSPVWLSYH